MIGNEFDSFLRREQLPAELLSELSRTTTAYHEATVDCLEEAREQYFTALRNFNAAQETCMNCQSPSMEVSGKIREL
jgi:hypothetical protein